MPVPSPPLSDPGNLLNEVINGINDIEIQELFADDAASFEFRDNEQLVRSHIKGLLECAIYEIQKVQLAQWHVKNEADWRAKTVKELKSERAKVERLNEKVQDHDQLYGEKTMLETRTKKLNNELNTARDEKQGMKNNLEIITAERDNAVAAKLAAEDKKTQLVNELHAANLAKAAAENKVAELEELMRSIQNLAGSYPHKKVRD